MSRLRTSGVAVAAAVMLCGSGGALPAWGHASALRLSCTAVANTCTVRIPITTADNNVQVVITTPRRNHGALITDNNHKPFSAMYNVDETSSGMTFTLKGVASVVPGTVLEIVFKLVPVGSAAAESGTTAAASTSSSAAAGKGSLALSGPAANKVGTSFAYKVSADVSVPAVFLAFEVSGDSCASAASAYSRSSARVHESVPAGSFSVTFHLVAEPSGTFALCIYLVSPTTNATEVHAGAHWTNGA
jgi:hypothetical protein